MLTVSTLEFRRNDFEKIASRIDSAGECELTYRGRRRYRLIPILDDAVAAENKRVEELRSAVNKLRTQSSFISGEKSWKEIYWESVEQSPKYREYFTSKSPGKE
jgi:hypothetical protein